MRINHNIEALNTYNKLSSNTKATTSALEKLSSGLRINKAGDDAAGLAISQKMQAQINGLDQASSNAQNGISLVQTAEGALTETQSILQRMATLVNQASSGTLQPTDRTAITSEITQLNSEIDRISQSTQFNGKNLLDGTLGVQLSTGAAGSGIQVGTAGVTAVDISGAKASNTYTLTATATTVTLTDTTGSTGTQTINWADKTAGTINFNNFGVKITVDGSVNNSVIAASAAGTGGAGTVITTGVGTGIDFQIGSNNSVSDKLALTIAKMDSVSLTTSTVDVSTAANAKNAIDIVNTAIGKVSTQRADLGAIQNRLEHTINNLSTESQNLSAASSQITDVDMAKEMTEFTKNNILTQAAQAMLAQANQLPQGVLSLLKS